QEGAAYCGTAWNPAECARPLLTGEALRDDRGRILSLKTSFGHPVLSGGVLRSRTPPQPWRGYGYDPMDRLATVWEHSGIGSVVSTAGLTTHTVRPQDIEKVAAQADAWTYERESAVGGTLSIRNASGNERFVLPIPRGPGHQLQQVRVDGRTRRVEHNATGQI